MAAALAGIHFGAQGTKQPERCTAEGEENRWRNSSARKPGRQVAGCLAVDHPHCVPGSV